MGQCVKCGAKFVGTAANPPGDGLCRYCELAKLKSDVEGLLTRSLKCFGHDSSCEVEKCDLDRGDDACTCEYKPLVADIDAFIKTVAPKL